METIASLCKEISNLFIQNFLLTFTVVFFFYSIVLKKLRSARNFLKINLKFPYIGLQSFPYDLTSSKYTLFFVFLYEGV